MSQVERVNWYKELAGLPTFTSAEVSSDNNVTSFTTSTQDFTRKTKRKATRSVFTSQDGAVIAHTSAQDVSPDVQLSATSPSTNRISILRQTGDKGVEKRFVEIWTGEVLQASVEVTDLHDAFYTDEYYGSISFSPSEDSIVYLAEAKKPKPTPESPFAHHRYTPSLGEKLPDRYRPTIFVARRKDEGHLIVTELDRSEFRAADVLIQPSFVDYNSLVVIAQQLSPDGQLLSVRGCFNHPTSVWKLDLKEVEESGGIKVIASRQLSDPTKSGRSPRVHHGTEADSTTIIWLEHELGGPHFSCSSLQSEVKGQKRTVVPYVLHPGPDEFKGLFIDWTLLPRPFLSLYGRLYLVCTSTSRYSTTLLLVDVQSSGKVIDATPSSNRDLSSWHMLATNGRDRIVCTRGTLTTAPQLFLGTIVSQGAEHDPYIRMNRIWDHSDSIPRHVQEALDNLKASVIPISYPVETIFLESKSAALPRKLITFIHGGPHGSSLTTFSPQIAAFALEGYAVSQPNYTGSCGYGADHVNALVGKCGSLDVSDVVSSVKELVKLGLAEDDASKQLIVGGSHGGFLGAHLVGQFPDMFSAAVLRNPVITSLPSETDIPDWYFEEFFTSPPGLLERLQLPPDLYKELYEKSPIAHVSKVKAPIRILLGLDDHRVSNNHGIALYHALATQKKTVDVLTFPGNGHAIDGVDEARMAAEATLDWFSKVSSSQ